MSQVDPSICSLLEAAYTAFNARDIDAVLAKFHSDVIWPNGMEGGYVHGQHEVRAYWTRQWQSINPTVRPEKYAMDRQGRVVVLVHQVVRDMTGQLLIEQFVQHAYSFEAGLVRSMEILDLKSL